MSYSKTGKFYIHPRTKITIEKYRRVLPIVKQGVKNNDYVDWWSCNRNIAMFIEYCEGTHTYDTIGLKYGTSAQMVDKILGRVAKRTLEHEKEIMSNSMKVQLYV